MNTLDKFLKEYDSGNLGFDTLKYRQGAAITSRFGLAKGFEIIDGKLVFNIVRFHSGVDRNQGPNDGIIYSPFFFNLATFKDYGPTHPYGSLIRLFNFEYGFEVRIAHVFPKDLSQEFRNKIDSMTFIPRDMILGKAGTYGVSSGIHTHTEFISLTEDCVTFEHLLREKFKNDWYKPYSNTEIIKFYRQTEKFKNSTEEEIMNNWDETNIKGRRIVGQPNKYKCKYRDWFYGNNIHTRYSSELLFNGL